MTASPVHLVREHFLALQEHLIARLEAIDGGHFQRDYWTRPAQPGAFAGDGRSYTLEAGRTIERGAVLFSHIVGSSLPPSASATRPHLSGAPYEVLGVSVVVHPRNPFAPTAHMNVRRFSATASGGETVSWVGGGVDLTPHYLFEQDATEFHQAARDATGTHYAAWKRTCDAYFWLKHRHEARGIGGVFFDDYSAADGTELVMRLGAAFAETYPRILERRKDTPYTDAQRDWQLHRRGRYVEFNLVWDRGTHFGLQSGGRTQSILASLPPLAAWQYDDEPAPGTKEAALLEMLRNPRDWL